MRKHLTVADNILVVAGTEVLLLATLSYCFCRVFSDLPTFEEEVAMDMRGKQQ